jgi:hypothetical protein
MSLFEKSLRPLLAAVVIASCSLLSAGCGGGHSPGVASVASSATTRTTGTQTAVTGRSDVGGELAEYSNCMRSHGISSFPDVAADMGSLGASSGIRAAKGQMAQVSESEAASPRFQAAQRACAKYYGQSGTPAQQVSPQELQKLLAVSRCMRAHGVPAFPDPDPTTGDFATPAGVDKNSPQVAAALRACSSLGRAAGLGQPNVGAG